MHDGHFRNIRLAFASCVPLLLFENADLQKNSSKKKHNKRFDATWLQNFGRHTQKEERKCCLYSAAIDSTAGSFLPALISQLHHRSPTGRKLNFEEDLFFLVVGCAERQRHWRLLS